MAQKPTAKLLAWKAFTRFVRVIAEEKRAANEKSQKEVTDDLVKRNLTVPATAPTVRTLRWSKNALECLKEATEEYLMNAISGAGLPLHPTLQVGYPRSEGS